MFKLQVAFPEWLNPDSNKIKRKINPYLEIIQKVKLTEPTENELIYIRDSFIDDLSLSARRIICSMVNDQIVRKEELLLETIKSGVEVEKITKHLDWKDFEYLTSSILSAANWTTTTNFRFFGEGPVSLDRKRFEIDILAWKRPYVLLIDCKRYGTPNKSMIKNSIEKQIERTYELFEMIPIIHDLKEMKWIKWGSAYMIPMIVTWRNHKIDFYEKVPVCSSNKLLDLLSSFNSYFSLKEWFHLDWDNLV